MAEKVFLPMIPEPILTVEERAQLAEVYADPAFWKWFEAQPEPPDSEQPFPH